MTMQITDEMVEAALVEWYDQDPKWFVMESAPRRDWTQEDNDLFVAKSRREMRATLEAALSKAPAVVNNPDGTVYSIAGVVIGPACHAVYPATFVQTRPAGCARGGKCSGAVVTIGALATPSCGLIGCKHNWNTTLGGRGTDQVQS